MTQICLVNKPISPENCWTSQSLSGYNSEDLHKNGQTSTATHWSLAVTRRVGSPFRGLQQLPHPWPDKGVFLLEGIDLVRRKPNYCEENHHQIPKNHTICSWINPRKVYHQDLNSKIPPIFSGVDVQGPFGIFGGCYNSHISPAKFRMKIGLWRLLWGRLFATCRPGPGETCDFCRVGKEHLIGGFNPSEKY